MILVAGRSAALVAALLALSSTATGAQPVDAGREKARACAVCHGLLGVSTTPDAPNLAGQPAIYIAAQLRAYRNGTRKHEVMAVMANPLTDDDITHLAVWFSSIKVEATPPP